MWRPHDCVGSGFQYLVKGISGWGDFEKFIAKPHSVRKQLNSCSVIRADFSGMIFGCSGGFILKAPADCVYAASHADMYVTNKVIGSPANEVADHLQELFDRFSLPSPATVCKRSAESFSPYNEVAVLGTSPSGEPVVIDAVLIAKNPDEAIAAQLRAIEHPLRRRYADARRENSP